MLRIATILCLVGLAMSGGMGGEAMMKKYGYMKIMASCFGEEKVMEWKMGMKAASDKCKGMDVQQTLTNIQAMLKSMRKYYAPTRQAQQQPLYVPVPVYVNQQQPFQQFQQFPQGFRTKRSAGWDLSPEGIEKMKHKMMSKISNMTCIMKEMNIIDADNQPKYEYFESEINELAVDQRLKDDLLEAMDMCRDFAMCLPVEKANTPIKRELGTAMGFMKCMNMKKAMVCMMNDFRKMAPMMGFEGDINSSEGDDLVTQISNMLEGSFEDVL